MVETAEAVSPRLKMSAERVKVLRPCGSKKVFYHI